MSLIRPFVVGLTGGIGSGKTTVSSLFAEMGVEVIDADVISRSLVRPGSPALQQLVAWYGPGLLTQEQALERAALRRLIFTDSNARQRVEALLHPLVRSAIDDQIARSTSQWLLLSAPLLLENQAYAFVDRVLVVDIDESQQVARTQQRDHSTEAEVRQIMQSQLTSAERLTHATEVIDNRGDLASLKQQVLACYQLYGKLANERQHTIAAL
jgi:dephospho-CoA kinase